MDSFFQLTRQIKLDLSDYFDIGSTCIYIMIYKTSTNNVYQKEAAENVFEY